MYDVKEWLSPHSYDIHHHVKPHCFKFVRNEHDKAVMYYRKWSDEKWMGPIRLLKVSSYKYLLQLSIHDAIRPATSKVIFRCINIARNRG